MVKWNDDEGAFECQECDGLISEDTWNQGVAEGWDYCPHCGASAT